MANIFTETIRLLLDTETDADSPGSELLMSTIRKYLETLLTIMCYTGDSGTATSDPPDDTTGYFYDTSASFTDDEHNGRLLVIVDEDSDAYGQVYEIDDTDAATDKVICTGDNLYSDGVRSGDAYKIFFDFKNGSAHTHDDINSNNVVLADGVLTQAKLGDYSAGDTVLEISSNAEVTTTSAAYTKVKEFYIPRGGEIRIKFDMKSTVGGYTSYGRIYKNGVAVGTEQSTSSTSYVTKSEDISGFSPGDLVQLYIKSDGVRTSYIENFMMYVADSFQAHDLT